MRNPLLASFVALALALGGCGSAYVDLVGTDGNLLGEDGNSNLLRLPLGAVHEVAGVVGRNGGLFTTSGWSEPVDTMSSRDPRIVSVERTGATTFRITAEHEGETVLVVTGDGEERFVPIRVMPADFVPAFQTAEDRDAKRP